MHSFVEGRGRGQGNPRQLIFIIHSQQNFFLGTFAKFRKTTINTLAPEFLILILAHSVFKM